MNRIDFTKPGGFPLDQDVFGFQQTNVFLASQAATLGGEYAILSGCILDGGAVSNGYVVIKGEILPFVGSQIDNKVVIVETANDLNYEDGSTHPSEIVRYATFGDDGVTNYLWTNFKRNDPANGLIARIEAIEAKAAKLDQIAAVFRPVGDNERGGMVLWKKPANLIPAGWQEVIDWRGRLPMGYDPGDSDFNEVGKASGSKTFTILKANLPNTRLNVSGGLTSAGGNPDFDTTGGSGSGYYRGTVQTDPLGDGIPVKYLNPNRVVMFIEYIGD